MNYLSQAIWSLCPGSEFSYENEDYATIEWHVIECQAPTQAAINAEIEKIKAAELVAQSNKADAKAALLDRLGITAEEAALLIK